MDLDMSTKENGSKGVSIVVACHDNSYELEHNLPALLDQQYSDFEVIVVDESSIDNTDDVLKKLKAQYTNLYTTFIPESSHYLSRRKLALTVGVKAAKHEWIVFVDVDEKPADDQWLSSMANQCNDNHDMVMGYANYSEDASTYYRYFQLLEASRNMRKACRSTAYASGGCTIAMRRSLFMEGNGFINDLEFLRGEYDFLVNEYAQKGRVGVVTDAKMVRDTPSHRSWVNGRLFYMETRRHLARSKRWRLPMWIDTFFLHLLFVGSVAAIVVASILSLWVVVVAACGVMVLLFVVRAIIGHKVARRVGERMPVALIPLMDLRLLWTQVALHLRYKASDKYDFIRK